MNTSSYCGNTPVQPQHSRLNCGFSLLELMIALLLITVLVAMAVPSYQQYVQRSHRMIAIEALLAAAGCQQNQYAVQFHYDTRSCIPQDATGKYSFRMEPTDAASTTIFTVIASPLGAQQQDVCKELSLDQTGWRAITGAAEFTRKCWEGR